MATIDAKRNTLSVINEIIEDSTRAMREEATKLLNTRDWDFEMFGDRNTFARTVMEVIFEKEKSQYAAINNTKAYKDLKKALDYELSFIH